MARGRTIGRLLTVVVMAGCLVACQEEPESPAVRKYVDRAIKILDRGFIANTLEWRRERARALPRLYAAESIPDTYELLDKLAKKAGGNHSSFQEPTKVAELDTPYAPDADFDVAEVSAADGIATLTIPTYLGSDPKSNRRYDDGAAKALEANRAKATCGWIVDVSDNLGGTTLPMIAAASPLLDDGVVMSFIDREGDSADVTVKGNAVWFEGKEGASLGKTRIPKVNKPVAIVQAKPTASAAEAVVISFLGQDSVKTFGEPTQGLSSANTTTEMSDGARVVLTEAVDVDRTGKIYGGPLPPDVATAPGAPARTEAEAWLKGQCDR